MNSKYRTVRSRNLLLKEQFSWKVRQAFLSTTTYICEPPYYLRFQAEGDDEQRFASFDGLPNLYPLTPRTQSEFSESTGLTKVWCKEKSQSPYLRGLRQFSDSPALTSSSSPPTPVELLTRRRLFIDLQT